MLGSGNVIKKDTVQVGVMGFNKNGRNILLPDAAEVIFGRLKGEDE
jgi:hypothetical protein